MTHLKLALAGVAALVLISSVDFPAGSDSMANSDPDPVDWEETDEDGIPEEGWSSGGLTR